MGDNVGELIDPADADEVAYDCTTKVTGSDRPFNPSDTLERYGVHTQVQCQSITVLVSGDHNIGVPHYRCAMSTNALCDLAPSWTMEQMSARIQQSAMHAEEG
jgi:hypothetical protein